MFGLKKKVLESRAAATVFQAIEADCDRGLGAFGAHIEQTYREGFESAPPPFVDVRSNIVLCIHSMELQSVRNVYVSDQADRLISHTLKLLSRSYSNADPSREIEGYWSYSKQGIEIGSAESAVMAIPTRLYIRLLGESPSESYAEEYVGRSPLDVVAVAEALFSCIGIGRWKRIYNQFKLMSH